MNLRMFMAVLFSYSALQIQGRKFARAAGLQCQAYGQL